MRDIWPIRLGAVSDITPLPKQRDDEPDADAVPRPYTEWELDKTHTETTRSDVSGQHDGRAAGLELGENPVTFRLLPEMLALSFPRCQREEE